MQPNPNPNRASRSMAQQAALDIVSARGTDGEEAAAACTAAPMPMQWAALLDGAQRGRQAAEEEEEEEVVARGSEPSGAGNSLFGFLPTRPTGLSQPLLQGRKRSAAAKRTHPAWDCVVLIDEDDMSNPQWKCLGCGVSRRGGATRVVDHVLGRNMSAQCPSTDPPFLALVDKVRRSEGTKNEKKKQKEAVRQVDEAAAAPLAERLAEGVSAGSVVVKPP
uniref:BED-type domain-containing protein n=1 Tax=Strombidinopsis acuminata TaxID=141414 RepID=A0A7S3W0L0_9SPIT